MQKYGSINGRARPSEFWLFTLMTQFFGTLLLLFAAFSMLKPHENSHSLAPLTALALIILFSFILVTFIPSICLSIRRLHDINLSGWFMLLTFIPLIGSLVLLVMVILSGTPVDNRFGPPMPKPVITVGQWLFIPVIILISLVGGVFANAVISQPLKSGMRTHENEGSVQSSSVDSNTQVTSSKVGQGTDTLSKAQQGDADAQYSLGLTYEFGQGVPQNYKTAVIWYQKAAHQGLSDAQFNLGTMYSNGRGVPQNYQKAVAWYQKAAHQGFSDAQFNLGLMYDAGLGVPKDYQTALMWMTMPAATYAPARKERDRIAQQLEQTRTQRQEPQEGAQSIGGGGNLLK